MLSLMNTIKRTAGIFGYWVISNESKISYKDVPGAYIREDLIESSIRILEVFNEIEKNKLNILWIEFLFPLYKVLIQRNKLGMIILLCTKEVSFSQILGEMDLLNEDAERAIAADSIRDSFQKKIDSNRIKPEFFSLMERSLADEIGPIARLLINEKVKEMGLDIKYFPHNKVIELLNIISLEKEDVTKRKDFKRDMMLALKLL